MQRWLQVALSLAGLLLTAAFVDVAEVRGALLQLSTGWLLASLGMQGVQVLLVAVRWFWINRLLGIPLAFRRALREYTVSASLNLLIPGGFAGDLVRGYRQARTSDSEQVTKVWVGVIADRAIGQLGVWLLAAVTLPFWLPAALHARLELVFALVFGAAALCVLGLALLARRRPKLAEALLELTRVLRSPAVLFGQLTLALALLLSWCASFYFASRALGFATPGLDVVRAAVPAVLAASIPGFVNGWGAREGAAGLSYGWAGLSATEGTTVAVTYGLVGLVLAALGLTLLFPRFTGEPQRLATWSRNHALITLAALVVSVCFGSPWVLCVALLSSFAHLVYAHRGAHTPRGRFGWANAITAARLALVLACLAGAVRGVSALVVVSASVLALDGLDGWVARRTKSNSAFGEHFDMETDAAFVMVVSWLLAVEHGLGLWALIPGVWRYAYVLLEALFPPPYGPAKRSNVARYAFVLFVLLQIAALAAPFAIALLLAASATLIVSLSFLRSAWFGYFGGRSTSQR